MTARIDDVTKPVRGAKQRPTPRWVGWFLIATPSLAAAGPLWGAGPWTTFRAAVAVLFLTAAWDWWRFQDRSRTFFTMLGIGIAANRTAAACRAACASVACVIYPRDARATRVNLEDR